MRLGQDGLLQPITFQQLLPGASVHYMFSHTASGRRKLQPLVDSQGKPSLPMHYARLSMRDYNAGMNSAVPASWRNDA